MHFFQSQNPKHILQSFPLTPVVISKYGTRAGFVISGWAVQKWFLLGLFFHLIKNCNHVFSISRTDIFEFLYCGNNTNPSMKLWNIWWMFYNQTGRRTSYAFIKQLIFKNHSYIRIYEFSSTSTLISKMIVLNWLIIYGQQEEFKSLAGKTVSLVLSFSTVSCDFG